MLNKSNEYSRNHEQSAIFIATYLSKAHYKRAITTIKNSKTIIRGDKIF